MFYILYQITQLTLIYTEFQNSYICQKLCDFSLKYHLIRQNIKELVYSILFNFFILPHCKIN